MASATKARSNQKKQTASLDKNSGFFIDYLPLLNKNRPTFATNRKRAAGLGVFH